MNKKRLILVVLLSLTTALIYWTTLGQRCYWPLRTFPGYCIVYPLDKRELCAINLGTGEKYFKPLPEDVIQYAFSHNGMTAAFASGTTLVVEDKRTGRHRIELPDTISMVAISPEGKLTIAEVFGIRDAPFVSTRLFLVTSTASQAILQVPDAYSPSSVQWIDERDYLYVGLHSKLFRVNSKTGKSEKLPIHAVQLAVSPDGAAAALDVFSRLMPIVSLETSKTITLVPLEGPSMTPGTLLMPQDAALYASLRLRYLMEVHDLMLYDWKNNKRYRIALNIGDRVAWCSQLPAWFTD